MCLTSTRSAGRTPRARAREGDGLGEEAVCWRRRWVCGEEEDGGWTGTDGSRLSNGNGEARSVALASLGRPWLWWLEVVDTVWDARALQMLFGPSKRIDVTSPNRTQLSLRLPLAPRGIVLSLLRRGACRLLYYYIPPPSACCSAPAHCTLHAACCCRRPSHDTFRNTRPALTHSHAPSTHHTTHPHTSAQAVPARLAALIRRPPAAETRPAANPVVPVHCRRVCTPSDSP